MKQFFRKVIAFFKRDFLINSSYRFSFILNFVSIFASVATFFFISKMFGEGASKYLDEFEGGYFSFVLIGLAFSGYLFTALGSFNQTISNEQAHGTLEILLLSPTSMATILLCGAIRNFSLISFRVFAYLILGWLVFGFDISNVNFISAFVVLILTIISFSSLGILSVSFQIVFKRGDPINWALNGVSILLGGIYFPISVLPLYMQKMSYLLPITYSVSAMRESMINGVTINELVPELTYLVVFFLIFFPIGIISFKLALNKAKKQSSLLYY